jgi:hypothetical protein
VGMMLPNAEKALVAKEKITEYLLSSSHGAGGGKARFFLGFGFKLEEWTLLSDTLIRHAMVNEVVTEEQTIFGKKYIIEGSLETPTGEKPEIRTVWFIGSDESVPRFITAYPRRRSRL